MEIYKEVLDKKDTIKDFFLEDSPDEILANIKVYNFINKIINIIFEGGIIGIGLFINIYNVNISLYKILDINDNFYTFMTNIWKDEALNKFMIIHYENNNHFNLLKNKYSQNKNLLNNNKDNTNKITNLNLNFRDNILNNKSLKESFFANKYVKVNGQYSY